MGLISWSVWLLLSVTALVLSVWHYRRRETPGRGRSVLAALRAAALSVLLLLLFDPELPAAGPLMTRGTQVLLDASLSMTLPERPGGAPRWDRAVVEARDRSAGRPVLLFGDRPRPAPADSLPAQAPGDGRSRLLPALQAAAEAGVRRVVVITDGGVEDADEVARWAARLGIELVPVRIGGDLANRTLTEVTAPAWIESGQPAVVEFGVAGAVGDSVRVVARRDGRIVGRAAVPAAGAGRLATGRIELLLDPPAGGGWVRLELAVEGDDALPDDDVRTTYIHVSDEPPGIALLSLRPDWEPRFLAPVLQQALGLPLRGWIRSVTGQYVRVAGGLDAGVQAGEADIQRALASAELVVLHGVGREAPEWVIEALRSSRRLLVFPADAHDRIPLPLEISAEQQAEFYVTQTVPPSPVAPLLAQVDLSDAAPLSGLRAAELPANGWSPLLATRGRSQGAPVPIIAAADEGGRRWAVALGSGYWNWAFRGGQERQLYERLWGAIAGWLIRQQGTATLAAVRPASLAWPRATPVAWVAPGYTADSLRITVTSVAGAVVQDTVIVTATDTTFALPPEPGHYSYRALVYAGANVTEATGVLTIEQYSPELSRRAVDITALEDAGTLVRSEDGRRRGTPIHATPHPYLLLLIMLAAEWVLRRRWGLR